ncbi:Eukaryotic translation initiation factor 2D [Morus notabilis]|uniref:Eukaryotic translation initiation factor 2D n=1 Tax=Morus notabilis TaxID=981085 RepID=W9S9N6_9ROSA|nr:Eukaryotic translation initiation factor 2D [Morus notabilis]
MFKKAIELKSHQRLSGADRKKLKRTVKDRFPAASDSDIDSLLPPKAEITVAKFQNRVHVYSVEAAFPVFFDIDGRGNEIFPTVYALWKVPDLMPSFLLKGGEVSRYVIGGADLMFPGISVPAEGLPSFSAGEPWAVKVPGNPAPIAVSYFLKFNAFELPKLESVEGHYVPNAGFLEDVVFEDPASSSCQTSDSRDDATDSSHNQPSETNGKEVEDSVGAAEEHPILDSASVSQIEGKNDTAEGITSGVADLKVTDTTTADEMVVEDQQPLSIEDVDMLLDKCLLQALHTTVKDKDLPMPGSTLWSNHVLPCRPSGVTLDIKKSSHKKLSKWLLAKSSTGLITAKEDKHKKEAVLFAVNRGHPDYSSFKPEKRKIEKSEQTTEHSQGESRSDNKMLEVAEIYKPSVHVNPIFTAVGAGTGMLYSASDAIAVVYKYIENENLVKLTNKSIVVLDAILCDALFKGAIKKGSTYPTEIHKKDLGSTFINRMQAHHIVTRGGESVVRKGGLKTIQIVTERRQGNKKVTKLSGMETFLIDADALASELQKKFACSTSVAELPGKKGHEVLVQGGVIDDLAKHLIERYGIPKRYIEVLDKTKK